MSDKLQILRAESDANERLIDSLELRLSKAQQLIVELEAARKWRMCEVTSSEEGLPIWEAPCQCEHVGVDPGNNIWWQVGIIQQGYTRILEGPSVYYYRPWSPPTDGQ